VVTARRPLLLPGRVERIDAYRCRVQLGADSLNTLAQEILAFGRTSGWTGRRS
jgi:hypothetical protein